MSLEPTHRNPDATGRRVVHPSRARRNRARLQARTRPVLRLVGRGLDTGKSGITATDAQPISAPITDATDPRWVLAVRAAEALEGALLAPEKRKLLLRLARVLGLTPFDANLVIAVVQDQARRGHRPHTCPHAGREQLSLIGMRDMRSLSRHRRAVRTAWLVTALLALEVTLIWWLTWVKIF